MSLENLDYKELGKDIYAQARDGELTQEEQGELLEKYESEKCQIQDEACENLEELRLAMELFQESLEMSRGGKMLKKLQMIIGISKSERDGVFGPSSFQTFIQYRKDTGYKGGITELLEKYAKAREDFYAIDSIQQRKELQPEGGKDGAFGQGTFRHMLKSELLSQLGDVPVAREALSQGDPSLAEKAPEQDENETSLITETISFNNSLGLSDADFDAAKVEARENGENPSYTEFREIIKDLNASERQQLQLAVKAEVDGKPGIGTYTHYLHSKIREAGFSIEEIATSKQITESEISKQVTQINEAFGIQIEEIPKEISAGDFVSYEPIEGKIIVFDSETETKQVIDTPEGVFDSIDNVFSRRIDNTNIIFETLDQLSQTPELEKQYIESLKQYISDNAAYDRAREIFCSDDMNVTETGTEYTLDFKGNRILSQHIVAHDIFGDIPYLRTANTTFINRQEPKVDFKTFDGASRLSVSTGTVIVLPNETEQAKILEYMNALEREKDIREAVEDNLLETIQNNDKKAILEYLELSTTSTKEREDAIREMQNIAYEQRLFSNMREMFTSQSEGKYTFSPENDLLGSYLTAFDIFGDYQTLISGEVEYRSVHEKNYTKGGKRLALMSGETIVELKEGTQRSEEGYEKLAGIESLGENWQKIYAKFLKGLSPAEKREVQNGSKPFTLVDATSKQMVFVDGSDVIELSVILGRGTTRGRYVENDRNTPLGMVHRFNTVKLGEERDISILRKGEPYIPDLMPADNASWRRLRYNSSVEAYYGDKYDYEKGRWVRNKRVTVVGMSLQSNESMGYGGRYFHLVGPNRNETFGCVGIRYEHRNEAVKIAQIIRQKGGFGFVDKP